MAEIHTVEPDVVEPNGVEVTPKDADEEEISFVENGKIGLPLDLSESTSEASDVVEEAEVVFKLKREGLVVELKSVPAVEIFGPEKVKEPEAQQVRRKKVKVDSKIEEIPVAENLAEEVTKVEEALLDEGPAEEATLSMVMVRNSKPVVEGTKDAEAVQEVSAHIEYQEVPVVDVAASEAGASVVEENESLAGVVSKVVSEDETPIMQERDVEVPLPVLEPAPEPLSEVAKVVSTPVIEEKATPMNGATVVVAAPIERETAHAPSLKPEALVKGQHPLPDQFSALDPTSSVSASKGFRELSTSERLKNLQVSKWSLKHSISVLNMIEKYATELRQTKEKHEKVCRGFLAGGSTIPSSDLVKCLKDELERLRNNDRETEWFCAFKEAGAREWFSAFKKAAYLQQYSYNAAVAKSDDWEDNEVMESIVLIYKAVEKGELEKFKSLMELLPKKLWSLSPGEYKGATPLHWAALHGRVRMVSFIQEQMACFIQENASFKKKSVRSKADMIKLRIIDARDDYGFTPLHLAVYYTKLDSIRSIKDTQMIEDLFLMGATNCATTSSSSFIIDTDCLSNPLYPIHLAIWFAHPLMVEKLLERWPKQAFVKTKCGDSSLHLAAWCANLDNDGGDVMSLLLNYLDQAPDAINSLNHDRQSPLHIATLNGNPKCVEALLRCQQIKVNERNWKGYTPLEIATVKLEQSTKLLKSSCSVHQNGHVEHKMEDDEYKRFGVSKFVDELDERRVAPISGMSKIKPLFDGLDAEALHRERQVYVDAANAILVGAALIASASFGAWLQPPLGYVPYYSSKFLVRDVGAPLDTYQSFVAIKQYWVIQLFWIFNSLSFFFSLATVIAGADAAVPRQGLILKEAVDSVRRGVKWASWLLSLAIVFVIGTFTTIGLAILPPIEKYRINMYVTSSIGLLVCGVMLVRLFRKLDNKHLNRKNISLW